MLFKLLSVACLATIASSQDYQDFQNVGRQAPLRISSGSNVDTKPTPVPILKQINRHNEDGSYTYGYEGADGSFKIETKLATGEVKGKYGYTDETGKVRIVEYGANKYGFQPSGEGITVAPPTLVDETTDKNGQLIADYEDEPVQRAPAPKYRPQAQKPRPQPPQQQQQQYYEYETSPVAQNYQHQPAAPKYTAPAAQRIQQAPPRLQIPGAQPDPLDVVYSKTPRPARFDDYEDVGPQTFPQQQQISQPRKDAFPSQLFTQAAGSPPKQSQQVAYQAPRLQQAPAQSHFAPQSSGRSGGVLDQLAKDYALPSGGTPLHDISFGYY